MAKAKAPDVVLPKGREAEYLELMADDLIRRNRPNAHATPRKAYKAKTKPTRAPKDLKFNLAGVADVLIANGLNPTEEIIRVLPELEPDVKARIMAELLQYIQPKLKSIEHSGTVTQVSMTDEERRARLAELQSKLHK